MSGREGGVVEWADYAALKAQSAEYEARIKELEQDVDDDAAAIQQLEQVNTFTKIFSFLFAKSVFFENQTLSFLNMFVVALYLFVLTNDLK